MLHGALDETFEIEAMKGKQQMDKLGGAKRQNNALLILGTIDHRQLDEKSCFGLQYLGLCGTQS